MQREYNFISKLNTNDVTYIISKKKEQAAINIQRAFRSRKQVKKQQMDDEIAKAGGTIQPKLTDEEIRQIEGDKRDLERLKEKVKERRPDLFYEPIPEERKKELIDYLTKKRRIFQEGEMHNQTYEEIDERYYKLYRQFCDDYGE